MYFTFKKAIEHADPEICANAMITLIKICTYLLKQQIRQLEIAFVNEGGLRERMIRARIERRKKANKLLGDFGTLGIPFYGSQVSQKNQLAKQKRWIHGLTKTQRYRVGPEKFRNTKKTETPPV
ncbi:four helix bundle suffix domain-containing protein [Cyclobacterium plantarum]|uniref:four helix bundle suffix domain-containing protein n=1 Tax=Cyclobacterium plantarum TaxID=2716263 RepID=UPI003F6F35AF